MENNVDRELMRLFDEKSEIAPNELFVKGVSKCITRRRYLHRVLYVISALMSAIFFVMLSPWLTSLTGYIALGSSVFANSVMLFSLSPAGWVIGSGIGLAVFLKIRL